MTYEELFAKYTYYKSEYEILGASIRQKNKDIAKLKKEITELKKTIRTLQEENSEEIESLFDEELL